MARIYNVRKWHYNSKKTGVFIELSCYDEASEKWLNVKAHIPLASEYAGKDEDEQPATLCAVKNGILTIKCKVFDDYTPKAQEADKKEARNAKKAKKAKPAPATEEDDDEDTDF